MQSPDLQHLPEDALIINVALIVAANIFPSIQDIAYFLAVLVSLGTLLVNWEKYMIKLKPLIARIKEYIGFFIKKK